MYTKWLQQCVTHSKFPISRAFMRGRSCSWTMKEEQDVEG